MERIGVIGGGAWGTALAAVAARAGRAVTLWAREPDVIAGINERHENRRFLPGVPLEYSIRATADLDEAADADLLLLVTPAQHLAETTERIAQATNCATPAVICPKGIERRTGALMSEAVCRVAPALPIAVLSGPTFAREVAEGLPAAVSLACEDARRGAAIVDALGVPAFRPYLTDDLIGVQIGGAVKNVIAIAAGIAIGRGLGDNARAAIIARGFAELVRLAVAKGARMETLAGLSGLGDLVLTCTSDQSRNFAFGRAVGSGTAPKAALASSEAVTEGHESAPAVVTMAGSLGVEMPIAERRARGAAPGRSGGGRHRRPALPTVQARGRRRAADGPAEALRIAA